MSKTIITEHTEYVHMRYRNAGFPASHMLYGVEHAADRYPDSDYIGPQIAFDDDMTVGDFVYEIIEKSKPRISIGDRWEAQIDEEFPFGTMPDDDLFYKEESPMDEDSGSAQCCEEENQAKYISVEPGTDVTMGSNMAVYCPWCSEIAVTVTGWDSIERVTKAEVPEEMICRNCGAVICFQEPLYPDNKVFKSETRRWTSADFFYEKYADTEGCVSAVLRYAISGINGTTQKLFNKYGAVRITMNMKTGMTYMMNAKIHGRYPDKMMKIIKNNKVINITYGSEYLFNCYGDHMGYCMMDKDLRGKLNEPVMIRLFSEALMRYRHVRKEDLTKKGDFSDTDFKRICTLNCMPPAAPYLDNICEMADKLDKRLIGGISQSRAAKRYLKDIRRVLRRGNEYSAGYLMNKKIPKSIRKMILKDPVNYYVYRALRTYGFNNTDIIRSMMQNMDIYKAVMVLSWKERDQQYMAGENAARFIKAMIRDLGEKKTARILYRDIISKYNRYSGGLGFEEMLFRDSVSMYAMLLGINVKLRGKTIREMHDFLIKQRNRLNAANVVFSYTKKEKELNDVIDDTRFYLPGDRYELSDASDALHNCVGGYYGKILSKISTIVLMERNSRLIGCIEVSNRCVVQAYAPCNEFFPEEDNAVFDKWRSKHGLEGHADGWKI